MSNVITAEFHVAKRFEVDNQIGYLIFKCDDDKKPYYLAFESDIGARKVDERFEIELPFRNGRVMPTSWMINVWPTEHHRRTPGSAEFLKKNYLSYLYQTALRANTPSGSVQLTYDKETVFATPILRLIEELYLDLTKKKMRDELAKIDFLYQRRKVYTRVMENRQETNYTTPRYLTYHPDEQIVVATYWLTDTPELVDPPADQEGRSPVPVSHIRAMVVRTTKGEGWMTLREYMKADPKVDAYVRGYFAQGLGTVEELSQRNKKLM